MVETSPDPRQYIRALLNSSISVETRDGRKFIGVFLCTDKEANVIIGSCMEYRSDAAKDEEPRSLGLAMIPGKHIVKMLADTSHPYPANLTELVS